MCEPRSKTQLNIVQLMGKEPKKQAKKCHQAVTKAFAAKRNGSQPTKKSP